MKHLFLAMIFITVFFMVSQHCYSQAEPLAEGSNAIGTFGGPGGEAGNEGVKTIAVDANSAQATGEKKASSGGLVDKIEAAMLFASVVPLVLTGVNMIMDDHAITGSNYAQDPNLKDYASALEDQLNQINKQFPNGLPTPAQAAAVANANAAGIDAGTGNGGVASSGGATGGGGYNSSAMADYNSLAAAVQNRDYPSMMENPLFKSVNKNIAEDMARKKGISAAAALRNINNSLAKTMGEIKSGAKPDEQSDRRAEKLLRDQRHEMMARDQDIFAAIRDRYINRQFAGLFIDINAKVDSGDKRSPASVEVQPASVPARTIVPKNRNYMVPQAGDYQNRNINEVNKW